VPATDDDPPRVVTHAGVGNIGIPEPAFCGRWRWLCRLPKKAVGTTVVEALEDATDELLALAGTYAGSEWDGSNLVGRWSDGEPWDRDAFELGVATYDTADSYLSSGSWEEWCDWHDVKPDMASEGVQALAKEIAEQARDADSYVDEDELADELESMRAAWADEQSEVAS